MFPYPKPFSISNTLVLSEHPSKYPNQIFSQLQVFCPTVNTCTSSPITLISNTISKIKENTRRIRNSQVSLYPRQYPWFFFPVQRTASRTREKKSRGGNHGAWLLCFASRYRTFLTIADEYHLCPIGTTNSRPHFKYTHLRSLWNEKIQEETKETRVLSFYQRSYGGSRGQRSFRVRGKVSRKGSRQRKHCILVRNDNRVHHACFKYM